MSESADAHLSPEKENWWRWGSVLEGAEKKSRVFWSVIGVVFWIIALTWEQTPAAGMIGCPFRWLTGYSCPGCGMTRSCTSVAHGDLWLSLEYHPLGIGMVLFLTFGGLLAAIELFAGRHLLWPYDEHVQRAKELFIWGLFVFVVGFGGLRLVLEVFGILTPV